MSGGFLERWSRRKGDEGQAVQAPEAVPPGPPTAEPAPPPPPDSPPDSPPPLSAEELAALPRIEDLTPQSSLAPFLRAGVPPGLKNAAMRKMWLLTPAIRDHSDCAVDYHWDWNTPGGVPGSGGRLDPAAVQKMLRGLAEPRPGPEARPEAEQEAAAKPDAAPEATAETVAESGAATGAEPAPENLPRPVVAPDAAAAPATRATTPSAPPAGASHSDTPGKEQRRRHGGAMPG